MTRNNLIKKMSRMSSNKQHTLQSKEIRKRTNKTQSQQKEGNNNQWGNNCDGDPHPKIIAKINETKSNSTFGC